MLPASGSRIPKWLSFATTGARLTLYGTPPQLKNNASSSLSEFHVHVIGISEIGSVRNVFITVRVLPVRPGEQWSTKSLNAHLQQQFCWSPT
jgi:hypothetical protein